jgi:adenylyltransferase/sulfurtransferase
MSESDIISVAELKTQIKNDKQLLLIDVRTQQERDVYNISGILIPLADLPQQLDNIDRSQNIVVYCHTGARSMMAVKLMKEAGFPSVKSLAGGMMAWQAEMIESETV